MALASPRTRAVLERRDNALARHSPGPCLGPSRFHASRRNRRIRVSVVPWFHSYRAPRSCPGGRTSELDIFVGGCRLAPSRFRVCSPIRDKAVHTGRRTSGRSAVAWRASNTRTRATACWRSASRVATCRRTMPSEPLSARKWCAAPDKVTTPDGEVKVLDPDDTNPHRFPDLGGKIASPCNSPKTAEAAKKRYYRNFGDPAAT